MWEGGSLPNTTSERRGSALVQPRQTYICEVASFSLEKRTEHGPCRVYDEYGLKNIKISLFYCLLVPFLLMTVDKKGGWESVCPKVFLQIFSARDI